MPPSQGLACPVTQLTCPQAFVKRAPTGNRLLFNSLRQNLHVFKKINCWRIEHIVIFFPNFAIFGSKRKTIGTTEKETL